MNFPEWIDLNAVWFTLTGALLAGYAILDGFDLGVGALHLFTRTDEERRIMINAIGPVWDGNEVWLVTGGGALFAAFPPAYASAFSGFYVLFMLLLAGLIFRAVAIEFRSKEPMRWWRQMWDVGFSLGSIGSSFIIGLAIGNIAWGVPLNERGEFEATTLKLLHPYALLLGVTTVALFMMHGGIYAVMKTEGDLQQRLRRWVTGSTIFFINCYVITTMVTLLYVPHMAERVRTHPWLFSIVVVNILAIANIPREFHHGRDFRAFLSSCVAMGALMTLFGLEMYPNLIIGNPETANSLTIYNSASSQKTLSILLLMAIIGMPLVIAYTTCIYLVFRGKVKLDTSSY